MEEAEIKATESPLLKAKNWSLFGKVAGSIIIIAGHILKWTGVLAVSDGSEIIFCGFAVASLYGTVDLNIFVDKFTKK